ncbi:hypothetical protein RCH07_003077 [Arthrobacter sp. CG_A4]|nr:hypothetical protein [Arthrobacter sp. CG_A4]
MFAADDDRGRKGQAPVLQAKTMLQAKTPCLTVQARINTDTAPPGARAAAANLESCDAAALRTHLNSPRNFLPPRKDLQDFTRAHAKALARGRPRPAQCHPRCAHDVTPVRRWLAPHRPHRLPPPRIRMPTYPDATV